MNDPERGHPIVLFDGLCGLCDSVVQRWVARDKKRVLRFASLQSEAGRALLEKHGLPGDLSTMVLVEGGAGSGGARAEVGGDGGRRAFVRSRAVLRTFGHLGFPWRVIGWLRVLPAWITDPFYRLVSRNRYRIRGRLKACRIPRPGEETLFLESLEDLERLG